MLAAVGEKAVGESEGLARSAPFVAVAFVFFIVVEGFGVGEDDAGAFAAGDGKFGVGGGEGFAVEGEARCNSCDSFGKPSILSRMDELCYWILCRIMSRVSDFGNAGLCRRVFHVREVVRDQPPWIVAGGVGGVGVIGTWKMLSRMGEAAGTQFGPGVSVFQFQSYFEASISSPGPEAK